MSSTGTTRYLHGKTHTYTFKTNLNCILLSNTKVNFEINYNLNIKPRTIKFLKENTEYHHNLWVGKIS